MLARIDSHPRCPSIGRVVNAAANLTVLIILVSIAGKYFVGVPRIDQNTREVAEGKIYTASRPVFTAIMRLIEGLLGSDIDKCRALWILSDDVYRRRVWNS